ncbi:MAG: hypothetical protein OXE77_11225 [Flavobacteriaceae bacterium]|nr:hypothetical protein [Flavobacteriaceae bacterium]MCY4268391.1 hypothetical protein [Flavobacteriaceae bacterium]
MSSLIGFLINPSTFGNHVRSSRSSTSNGTLDHPTHGVVTTSSCFRRFVLIFIVEHPLNRPRFKAMGNIGPGDVDGFDASRRLDARDSVADKASILKSIQMTPLALTTMVIEGADFIGFGADEIPTSMGHIDRNHQVFLTHVEVIDQPIIA